MMSVILGTKVRLILSFSFQRIGSSWAFLPEGNVNRAKNLEIQNLNTGIF